MLYRPYGETAVAGDDTFRSKFNTHESDRTALMYFNASYYDAEIGRFVSADTQIVKHRIKIDKCIYVCYVRIIMNFEWDENKNLVNIQKHLIPFDVAASVFDNTDVMLTDTRKYYKEVRYIAYGKLVFGGKELVLAVIVTYRKGTIRIISARKAKKKERLFYHENTESPKTE